MTDTWDVLVPPGIDPSGPDSIADFARCTGMDEYEDTTNALDDIGRYHAVIVRVADVDAALARMSRRAGANVRTVYEGGLPESTVNRAAVEEARR